MKNDHIAKPRAIALLLAAVALPATPVLAQEAPPAVTETVAPPAAPAPAPEAAPAPAPTAQAPVFAPKQEVVQPLPPRPAPPVVAEEETAQPAATTRAQPVRRVARPVAAAPAVIAPTAAAPVTAPAASAPTPAATPAAPVPVPETSAAPEATPADTAATTTTETTTSTTPWMWIGLGIVALAALALVFLRGRKRREEDVYYEEPVIATEPVVAAPAAPVVTKAPVYTPPVVDKPVSKPVAATAVSDDERPWIGLSVWPKEVGNGTVQYDLVVENVGDVEAHDVRVSSLIIDGTQSTPMENALIEDGETRSIDIGAGHSIPIAQTIAVEEGKAPHILAEARYPLPGGGEGHIAARFVLDTSEDGTVEARLDDLLERV